MAYSLGQLTGSSSINPYERKTNAGGSPMAGAAALGAAAVKKKKKPEDEETEVSTQEDIAAEQSGSELEASVPATYSGEVPETLKAEVPSAAKSAPTLQGQWGAWLEAFRKQTGNPNATLADLGKMQQALINRGYDINSKYKSDRNNTIPDYRWGEASQTAYADMMKPQAELAEEVGEYREAFSAPDPKEEFRFDGEAPAPKVDASLKAMTAHTSARTFMRGWLDKNPGRNIDGGGGFVFRDLGARGLMVIDAPVSAYEAGKRSIGAIIAPGSSMYAQVVQNLGKKAPEAVGGTAPQVEAEEALGAQEASAVATPLTQDQAEAHGLLDPDEIAALDAKAQPKPVDPLREPMMFSPELLERDRLAREAKAQPFHDEINAKYQKLLQEAERDGASSNTLSYLKGAWGRELGKVNARFGAHGAATNAPAWVLGSRYGLDKDEMGVIERLFQKFGG